MSTIQQLVYNLGLKSVNGSNQVNVTGSHSSTDYIPLGQNLMQLETCTRTCKRNTLAKDVIDNIASSAVTHISKEVVNV